MYNGIQSNYYATNTNYSIASTEWSLINFDFTESNHGIQLVYDETN